MNPSKPMSTQSVTRDPYRRGRKMCELLNTEPAPQETFSIRGFILMFLLLFVLSSVLSWQVYKQQQITLLFQGQNTVPASYSDVVAVKQSQTQTGTK